MPWYDWLGWAGPAAVLLVLAYGVMLVIRKRVLSRGGGTFELSYRVRAVRPGRGWQLGFGRYSGSQLEWFRSFTAAGRPKRAWQRTGLEYVSSHTPEGAESGSIYPDHIVVVCRCAGDTVELAMSPQSLIGFQAWLESRTPGTDWSRGR